MAQSELHCNLSFDRHASARLPYRIIRGPQSKLSGTTWRPGDRIRIRALRDVGSARLLDGLTGEITEAHPIAIGWYKIRLDNNEINPYCEWSAPGDRLVHVDEPRTEEIQQSDHAVGWIFP